MNVKAFALAHDDLVLSAWCSTTKTMISVQLEDLCSSEVNEGNRTSQFVAFFSRAMVECGSFKYIEPSRAIVECAVESSRVM